MAPDESPIERAERLLALGRPHEAANLLQALLANGRGGLLLRVTLVSALIKSGNVGDAIATAREAALLDPAVAVVAISLGEALLAGGKLAAAIGEFQRALRLDPDSTLARFGVGRAWLTAGEPDRAIEAFDTIADENAPQGLADFVAEARRMQEQPRSDARYVRHLFDEFSASYDVRMLGQLSYGAPAILRQLAQAVGTDQRKTHAILDFGCGTGLSGCTFADIARRLDGIDLSTAMIEKARERAIYDSLIAGDIEEWAGADRSGRSSDPACGVQWPGGEYDIILAADTLVYLGDLSKVFRGVTRRLTCGGLFLFTVEKSDRTDFELGPKRRWRHSEAYIRRLAHDVGLDVAGFMTCSPRTEAGVPVQGFAVALRNAAPCPAPQSDANDGEDFAGSS